MSSAPLTTLFLQACSETARPGSVPHRTRFFTTVRFEVFFLIPDLRILSFTCHGVLKVSPLCLSSSTRTFLCLVIVSPVSLTMRYPGLPRFHQYVFGLLLFIRDALACTFFPGRPLPSEVGSFLETLSLLSHSAPR